jgi:hypothetical protein
MPPGIDNIGGGRAARAAAAQTGAAPSWLPSIDKSASILAAARVPAEQADRGSRQASIGAGAADGHRSAGMFHKILTVVY